MSEISSFMHMLQLSDYQKQFWNGWKNRRKGTSYATMSRLKLITWLSRSICVFPKEKCIIDDDRTYFKYDENEIGFPLEKLIFIWLPNKYIALKKWLYHYISN